MTSTPTQSKVTSTQNSEVATEPPAKKQKCIGIRSVTDIQKILECPVCFNTPEIPDQAHFCSNGHVLCDGCHKKILEKKCPTCRSEDWNGHHTLLPLMKQIISALPKVCPFPECETQLEDKDREEHVKNCQYRLFDCVWTNGDSIPCKIKLCFKNDVLKHFEETHNCKRSPNIQGQFNYDFVVKESHFSTTGFNVWIPYITEIDGRIFIARCYRSNDIFRFQVFFLGSNVEAEKYSYEIKANTLDDSKYSMSFKTDVISVDIPKDDGARTKHSGTFSFTNSMAQKWTCEGTENFKKLSFDVTVKKNEM